MAITRSSWRLAMSLCAMGLALGFPLSAWAAEASAPAGAATAPPQVQGTPPSAVPGAAEPQRAPEKAEYRIQPGDTLSITVLGMAEYSGSFPVRPDGTILLQDEMVGPVGVAGATVTEVSQVLTARIGEYVKDPEVVLAISRFRVMVAGEVRQPGQYEVAAGARLMEVVERAGGAKDETRDLARVYLTKVSGEELRFSLSDFREKADASQNPLVEPGDRVSVGYAVSSKSGQFRVSGGVKKPGAYVLDESGGTRLSDAVDRAGRWTEDADARQARLIRKGGGSVTVDLTQLDQVPASDDTLLIQDGDELFVPRNTAVVNVLGGVKKPGQYRVAPGTTLLEAIALAGGLDETAVLRACSVVRSDPTPTRIPADLERLLKQGDASQNPALKDRDVVYVPTNPPPRGDRKNALEAVTDSLMRYWWVLRVF